jgi:translin
MDTLKDICENIRARFDAMDRAREGALAASRKVTRYSSDAIKAIHREEWEQARGLMDETGEIIGFLKESLKDFPEIYYSGYVEDAQVEYVEVSLLYAALRGLPLPTPQGCMVEHTAYLKGVGDATGELRRHILDLIRKGKPGEGEKYLDMMDEFYTGMMSFDYPDAIMHGLRKKTDVARSLIERTRGDLTNALEIRGLQESMARFEENIKK